MGITKSRDPLVAVWCLASEVSLGTPSVCDDYRSNPGLERGREGLSELMEESSVTVSSLGDSPLVLMEPLFSGTWQIFSGTGAFSFPAHGFSKPSRSCLLWTLRETLWCLTHRPSSNSLSQGSHTLRGMTSHLPGLPTARSTNSSWQQLSHCP